MMKTYIFKITLLGILLSFTNCDDKEFLTENPPSIYYIDNVFSSSAQVEQIIIDGYWNYRNLMSTSNGGWQHNYKYNGTDMYDVPSTRRASQFNDYSKISPLHSTFSSVYNRFYVVINNMNLALNVIDNSKITWASEEEKAYIIAQARFFRALSFLNLGELFGGVPIVTAITDVPKFDYIRQSRAETYQFVIDELLEIENNLPEVPTSKGRISRAAAQHYLCEAYLGLGIELNALGDKTMADAALNKSIEFGNKVIDSGRFSLISGRFGTRLAESQVYFGNGRTIATSIVIDTCQTNYYWDLFQEGNQDLNSNTESIWTMQIDYGLYKTYDAQSRLPYARDFGTVLRANSAGHWDSNSTNEDVGGRGITSINITFYTRDSIFAGAFAGDMRNSQIVFRRKIKGNKPGKPYYKKYVPWNKIYITEKDKTQAYPISCKICSDKFTGVEDGEDKSNLFRGDYFIRLPETILLRAEAKQRLGDKEGAANDVNLLRIRSQCSYLVTAADFDDDFSLILDERARELVYEERRWNTLLRMGGNIAVNRIKKYAFWPEAKTTLTFDYNLWPIPQEVVNLNIAVPMDQNPGWE